MSTTDSVHARVCMHAMGFMYTAWSFSFCACKGLAHDAMGLAAETNRTQEYWKIDLLSQHIGGLIIYDG